MSGTTGYDYAGMTMPDDVGRCRGTRSRPSRRRRFTRAGIVLADVVRARYVVTDRAHAEAVFAALGEAFGEIRPAATMTVSGLIEPAMKVGIDVTAHRPSATP